MFALAASTTKVFKDLTRSMPLLALLTVTAGLACTPGGPGAPGESDNRRHVQPKRDEILGAARGSVLLLGTYDFPPAVFEDKASQVELDEIVEKLIEFRPTKIAVGVPAWKQDKLDEHYKAYLGGTRKPGNSALDLIALRTAEALNHSRVWGIDAREQEAPAIDVRAWAAAHDQTDRLTSDIVRRYDEWYARERRYQATESIEDNLVWLNDPRHLAEAHGRNLVGEFNVGAEHDYPGVDALTGWYNRHLRIFANLQRIVESDGERILVVIDAAHVSLLRHSIDASPQYDLVEVNEFLGDPQGAERQVVPLL
jgi:hypothetical protein